SASATVSLAISGTALRPGTYEGYLVLQSANTTAQMRVPYWYAVGPGAPAAITILETAADAELKAGATVPDAILFHVTDQSGVLLTSAQPTASVVSGGGTVSTVRARKFAPGLFSVSVKLGAAPGDNEFRIQLGDLSQTITLTGY